MNYFKLSIILILILWIFGFMFIIGNNNDDKEIVKRLNQAELELEKLEQQNAKNLELIERLRENLKKENPTIINDNFVSSNRLSFEFEDLRRKTYTDLKDLSYYINSKFEHLANIDSKFKESIDIVNKNVDHRVKVLLAEMYNSSISSNLGEQRAKLAHELHKEVQLRFKLLQNPSDCNSAKVLVCDLAKPCGFGCQMHHVMYCFIESYFQNRTMILDSSNWRYDPNGYENYFKPLSDKCDYKNQENRDSIRLGIIDSRGTRPTYLPLGVPKDLVPRILQFHNNPFVWWAGEILTFLMRFSRNFEKELKETTRDIGLRRPCVGVHVRRTDKIGTEAALHHLDEYMKHVKDYFDLYSLIHPNDKQFDKIVYLASDELSVMDEANQKYKNYKFVFNKEIAQSAVLSSRYSPTSLKGVIQDIYQLSQCDYLVCTFSSQVCRMAYELMQPRYPDASWRFKSLDDIYYFGGQNDHKMRAIYNHIAENENEIDLIEGDIVGIAGDHWNGYSKGKNERTGKIGLFPSYKVKDIIVSA